MLGNDFRDYYEYYRELQKEYGFKYLPGNDVRIQTEEGIKKAKICTPCYPEYNGKTRYNGWFIGNGNNEGFIDIAEILILDNIS